VEFSSFLELKQPDAKGLVDYLNQGGRMQSTAIGPGVPFHVWPEIWAEWPDKEKHGEAWQECFHWFDASHDGLLDKNELESAFSLSRTSNIVGKFCSALCKTFPNEDALWATWANGAKSVLSARFDFLWNRESQYATSGISASQAFSYIDKDGNGAIFKDEFKSCYDAGNCGKPLPLIGGILNGGLGPGSAAAHLEGFSPEGRAPVGGGCNTLTSRSACCLHTDGRHSWFSGNFNGEPCVPSAEGQTFTSGNICEPECWTEGTCGGEAQGSRIGVCQQKDQNALQQTPATAAAPAPTDQADASTALSGGVAEGSTVLPVTSIADFEVGRQIIIDTGNLQEVNVIANFPRRLGDSGRSLAGSSISLQQKLRYAHSAGASVIEPKAAAPFSKATVPVPSPPAQSSSSSAEIPIWVWPVSVLVLACLAVVIAVAAAPFFFQGHKRSTVSSIGEASEADLAHDSAYNNLGIFDAPESTHAPLAPAAQPTFEPGSPYRANASMPAPLSAAAVASLQQPPQLHRPFAGASVTTQAQRPASPLATFVPYPQRGQGAPPRTGMR
jgi:Ca2+-binding EF-hand superfamily protein